MAALVTPGGKRFKLQLDRATTIGRGPDNDIVLQDSSVSRRHAVVQPEDGGFFIQDLNSGNGTHVKTRRIQSERLSDGDLIRFGNIELTFDDRDRTAPASQKMPDALGSRSRATAHRPRSKRVLLLIAIAITPIIGFGATELILSRKLPILGRKIEHAAPAGDSNADVTPSDRGIPAAEVGKAIVEMDRMRAGDSSWVTVASVAEMCNSHSLDADSLPCRVAYAARHAEGKDMDRDPNESAMSVADVARICADGVIDQNSAMCVRADTAHTEAEK